MDINVDNGRQEVIKIEAILHSGRQEVFDEALRRINESCAVKKGHFAFHQGTRYERHGSVFVNPRRLFRFPEMARIIVRAFVDTLPLELLDQSEVIAGPVTGGTVLAHDLGHIISQTRRRGAKAPEVVFFDRDQDDPDRYVLHPSDEEIVYGKSVILIDDVRHTGRTMAVSARVINEAGGRVIATAQVIDRGMKGLPLLQDQVPNFFLKQLNPDPLYPPAGCPLCAQGVPITQF